MSLAKRRIRKVTIKTQDVLIFICNFTIQSVIEVRCNPTTNFHLIENKELYSALLSMIYKQLWIFEINFSKFAQPDLIISIPH
jgi:hypothetical protein